MTWREGAAFMGTFQVGKTKSKHYLLGEENKVTMSFSWCITLSSSKIVRAGMAKHSPRLRGLYGVISFNPSNILWWSDYYYIISWRKKKKLNPYECNCLPKITELIKLKLIMADPTVKPSKLWHIAFQVTAFSLVRGQLPCWHSSLSSTVGQRQPTQKQTRPPLLWISQSAEGVYSEM